jgi:hypothetical protein
MILLGFRWQMQAIRLRLSKDNFLVLLGRFVIARC